jgi:hypothetical protein
LAVLAEREYTEISRSEIASSGIGVSPRGIASYEDLQRAAFSEGPAASEAAKNAADQAALDAGVADAKAVVAGVVAEEAQGTADAAMMRADDAYDRGDEAYERADEAYDYADTKVAKDFGATWGAATGIAARTAYEAYEAPTISNPPTQAEVQGVADAVQAMSRRMVALISDLRANGALSS